MARIPDLKRIQKEDFDKDVQDTIDKLAFPINSFMEQTKAAFDHSIDFTNLNQQLITLETSVDINGKPIIETKYRSTLKTRVAGHACINAINLVSSNIYVTGAPFISFIQNENIVTVLSVTGLQPGQKYRLVLLSIGQ